MKKTDGEPSDEPTVSGALQRPRAFSARLPQTPLCRSLNRRMVPASVDARFSDQSTPVGGFDSFGLVRIYRQINRPRSVIRETTQSANTGAELWRVQRAGTSSPRQRV